jgi:RNA-directed DNA polymerase
MDTTARCAQGKRLTRKTMHGWRAVYIERCPYGSVGGSQKPGLETVQGAGSPPNVKGKYWWTIEGRSWTYATPEGPEQHVLRRHAAIPIQRHIKVKGKASPFDGNLLYWAKRLKDHPLTKTTLGKLLQKQQGKCQWCQLFFREGDHIEIDHITPKSEGGGEELSNKFALHRHCHDQRHAKYGSERVNDN